jgi:CRP-like cAMP-binding protein
VDNFEAVTYEDAEWIFKAGDFATHLYLIQIGTVELVSSTGFAFAAISEGKSFGEAAILPGGLRAASARAKGHVQCARFSADVAADLLKSYSPLLVDILEALLLEQSMHNALREKLP